MYFETKEACQVFLMECRAQHDSIYHVNVAFEPDHGWLAVIYTHHIIPSLEGKAEQRTDGAHLSQVLRNPPKTTRTTPDLSTGGVTPPTGEDTPTAPKKGATKRVWDIATELTAKFGYINREEIMEACIEAGINKSTAATQFGKWKKAQNNG